MEMFGFGAGKIQWSGFTALPDTVLFPIDDRLVTCRVNKMSVRKAWKVETPLTLDLVISIAGKKNQQKLNKI